jgi:hypothetical protein
MEKTGGDVMKPYKTMLSMVMLLVTVATWAQTNQLILDRPYEPIVMQAGPLYDWRDVPVGEMFVYAFDQATHTWRMMPFQIDQRVKAEDPFKPGEDSAWRHTYFAQEDNIFDEEDELVFMVRDLGDKAADYQWIADEDSRTHPRLELTFYDSQAPDRKAYAYVYRSAAIQDPVPTPYDFSYDINLDQVESKYYGVAIDKNNGLIKNVYIKQPWGTAVDFFDTQKIRFSGVLDLSGGNPISLATDENILYLYDYRKVTAKPVVRLIRETRETIRFGSTIIDDIAFYLTTKFYPFSGRVDGGEKLDTESLKEAFQTEEDLYVDFKYLRQSWDLNENASGMKFYSNLNQDIPIDGMPDQVDRTVGLPIRQWTLNSGPQGSFFTFTQFKDTVSQQVGLYFCDKKKGAPLDSIEVDREDSGDMASYGDQGLWFKNVKSMRLGFTAYFLPSGLGYSDGEKLAKSVASPVSYASRMVNYPTAVQDRPESLPADFSLWQNYPNPFNASTRITFNLPHAGIVRLDVFGPNGQKVATVLDQHLDVGEHSVKFNAADLPSGLYICRLAAPEMTRQIKMLLIK